MILYISMRHTREDLFGIKSPCRRLPSRSTSPIRNKQNLVAFQSLLQNFLYPSILPTSKLISRPAHQLTAVCAVAEDLPPEVKLHRPNLKASVPHWGIPLGKIFFCPSSALIISFSGRLPVRRSLCNFSRVAPSMTSMGSMTFPRDFDIFLPKASRTMGWQ